MLKNKCCLYVIISIRFFSITICNLFIEFPSYLFVFGMFKDALNSSYYVASIDRVLVINECENERNGCDVFWSTNSDNFPKRLRTTT